MVDSNTRDLRRFNAWLKKCRALKKGFKAGDSIINKQTGTIATIRGSKKNPKKMMPVADFCVPIERRLGWPAKHPGRKSYGFWNVENITKNRSV